MRTARLVAFALLGAAALGCGHSGGNTPEPASLRLMSFNIRIDCGGCDGPNGWEFRRDGVVGMLPFHQIDLAGLQEVKRNQLEDLIRGLPEYAWIGRERGPDNEACPIFYRKARLQLLEDGTFQLSPTPDVPGSLGWDARYPRIATWGKFKDRATATTFFLFNTHLDSVGPTAREQGAKLITERIEAMAGPHAVLLTGDFNSRPGSWPYTMVTGRRFVDARRASRRRPYPAPDTGTSTGFSSPPQARAIIDYIFVSPTVEVLSFGVVTENWDLVFPSDHRPILADVRLPQAR